jgi:hypothetical protein
VAKYGIPFLFLLIKVESLGTMYYGGQKISSTTVIPLTYALKQPLGTNNLTAHVDILCQCSYGPHTFQTLICKRQS